jgi:hypothetical protein
LAVAALPAMAAAQEPAAGVEAGGLGSETQQWLALQVSGASASAEARPMPGEVATQVYQRYLASFSHPIPETFQRQDFVSSGGGGGSSSGGSH